MRYQSTTQASFSKIRSIDDAPVKRQLTQSWWVEVKTSVPLCTYHFGPFDHRHEARIARADHVENLEAERARDIVALVKQRHQLGDITISKSSDSVTC